MGSNELQLLATQQEQPGEDLVAKINPSMLNKWLSIFLAETTGEPYPPPPVNTSLHSFRTSETHANNRCSFTFKHFAPQFQQLQNTMDLIYRQLRTKGVGTDSYTIFQWTSLVSASGPSCVSKERSASSICYQGH